MKKTAVLSWLLLGTMILSACGGASRGEESSVSQPPAQSAPQEQPAQSAMAPAAVTPLPDSSQPDASVQEEQPDVSQEPVTPAATTTPVVSRPKPATTTQKPDVSAELPGDQSVPSGGEDPAATEPEQELNSAPTKADAQAYIGKSVSSLIAALGAPKGSDYAPSCLGDGEDGELFYDGFTVYTYRVNGVETVQDVA